jgi:hypothetical protein
VNGEASDAHKRGGCAARPAMRTIATCNEASRERLGTRRGMHRGGWCGQKKSKMIGTSVKFN